MFSDEVAMVKLGAISLPEGFLDDEIRNGYFVPRKQKEIWAVELDLLAKFIMICEKHNITYYADSGTLLGAIRHGGFIPWDDDVDLSMLRIDYLRFCEIAKQEIVFPYFFQTEETDPGSARKHAQIRNSLTTGIIKREWEYNYKFNQGIFIDIFPLDNLPSPSIRECFYSEINDLREKSNKFTDDYTRQGDYRKNPYYEEFEKCISRYDANESQQIGNLALMGGKRTSNRYRRDYMSTVELPFEFIKIKAPVGYKNELRRMFGIWKQYKIYDGVHGDVFFDTDKPYTEYIS